MAKIAKRKPKEKVGEKVDGLATQPKPSMSTKDTLPAQMGREPTKKSKKAEAKAKDPSPQPAPTSDAHDDSDVEGDVQFNSGEDAEVHLHGFSTDDDDSSDEEGGMDFEASSLDITKLPTVAKDDAIVKRKLDKAKRQPVRILL